MQKENRVRPRGGSLYSSFTLKGVSRGARANGVRSVKDDNNHWGGSCKRGKSVNHSRKRGKRKGKDWENGKILPGHSIDQERRGSKGRCCSPFPVKATSPEAYNYDTIPGEEVARIRQ